jgi:hypothetical protein
MIGTSAARKLQPKPHTLSYPPNRHGAGAEKFVDSLYRVVDDGLSGNLDSSLQEMEVMTNG